MSALVAFGEAHSEVAVFGLDAESATSPALKHGQSQQQGEKKAQELLTTESRLRSRGTDPSLFTWGGISVSPRRLRLLTGALALDSRAAPLPFALALLEVVRAFLRLGGCDSSSSVLSSSSSSALLPMSDDGFDFV